MYDSTFSRVQIASLILNHKHNNSRAEKMDSTPPSDASTDEGSGQMMWLPAYSQCLNSNTEAWAHQHEVTVNAGYMPPLHPNCKPTTNSPSMYFGDQDTSRSHSPAAWCSEQLTIEVRPPPLSCNSRSVAFVFLLPTAHFWTQKQLMSMHEHVQIPWWAW